MSFEQIVAERRKNSPKAAQYERYMTGLKSKLDSRNPADMALVSRVNDELARCKNVSPGTVHITAALSNISVQYQNEEYIGERLMPSVQVDKKTNTFFVYDKRSRLAYPDDALGERGVPNEISDSRSTDTYACVSRGFSNFLDAETLENQDAPLNEMVDLTEALAEGLAFKREMRIATKLTSTANFATGNYASISAGSRWDTAGGGNPIKDIQDGMAAIWMGRGPSSILGYCDLDTYNVLSRHPAILDLFKYNGSSPGLASPSMIAGFLGMEDLLVAKSRKETANEGQTAAYSRIWGNCFGMLRVAKRPSTRTAAFGYTFRHGPVESQQWFDPIPGKRGGYVAKVTCSEDHKIVANDTGYLIATPIG